MSNKKQQSQINQFTRLVNFCKSIPEEILLAECNTRLNATKQLYEEFKENQSEIEEKCGEELIQDQYTIRGQVEDYFYFCSSRLTEAINIIEKNRTATGSNSGNGNNGNARNQQQEVKLPRIELTSFSGKYEDWTSFKDLFTTLIHSNNSISNVQKLHYLKTNIEGDAQRLLKSVNITEANYDDAWKKLTDRYDHKRFIVDSYLKNFFNQPSIKSENCDEIKTLIDRSSEIIQGLKMQGIPVNQWDSILVHVIVSKLDTETHKQWELRLTKDNLPRFNDLETFLESRWQSLEMIQKDSKAKEEFNIHRTYSQNSRQRSLVATKTSDGHGQRPEGKCYGCGEKSHKISNCPKYSDLNETEKRDFIKSNRMCFNCLATGHLSSDCTSLGRCKVCKNKHHTSIHTDTRSSASSYGQQSSNDNKHTKTAISASNVSKKRVLLATAIVYVHTSTGQKIPAKALIDSGSDNSVIVEKLTSKLELSKIPDASTILGLGDVEVATKNTSVKFMISSHVDPTFLVEVEATTINKITGDLPMVPIHRKNWPHLQSIKFADPHFDRPSPIEILLGAEVYEQIIMDGIIPKKDYSPTAQNSQLGWLLFGVVKSRPQVTPFHPVKNHFVSTKSDQLDSLLRTFWEMEEIPEIRKLTVKEQSAEDSFNENVHRSSEGRYVVALPFDPDKQLENIGESRKAALFGLYRMENRFKSNNVLKERYKSYIQELIRAGHMERVPRDRMHLEDKDKFYLPHHAVLKEESLTTKLRVVFDASRKSSTGVSLNDKVLVGPKTQEDLYSILIRWRKHSYVFIADIEKMYRQVELVPEHRDFQRLLWRFEPNEPILEYRITRVIEGTASAAYLATRTLIQLAEDTSNEFPVASKVVRQDFYVDDLSSGSHSIEEAKLLQNDLIEIMKRGKFVLRKWFSNTKEILENVPEENRHDHSSLVEIIEKSIKTLGVYWNQLEDSFEFKIANYSKKHHLSKRELLSDISKLFDPIGWLAPSTITAKIFMQKLWSIKGLNWDDKIPEYAMKVWRNYRDQLYFLENIKIPRWIGTKEIVQIQLHGFGDASSAAYSAVVYSRVVRSDGSILVKLLSAKTKVSPVKVISTPKLELCGSVLVSRLMHKVKDALKFPKVELFTYSDNMTVLAWIKSHPNHYNTFVANRITEIQTLTNASNWFFVATDDNPADCASRGVPPSELKNHHLWWTGPKWLTRKQSKWPSYDMNYNTDLEKRKLPSTTFVATISQEDDYLVHILKKHSSLVKLLWNTSFITKFCSQSKVRAPKTVDHPNAQDLRIALRNWIRYIQHRSFRDDVERCKAGDELLTRSKLKKLRPFVDVHGILRVGGRLSKSNLPFSSKHPIILPKNNYFTRLIIEQAHKYTLHGGPTLMSTFLSNYWIFGRSEQIKKSIGSCVICFPHRCKPSEQLMADLPINRVSQHRAFLHTGVDFAGPLTTKTYTGRSRGVHSNPTQKSYVSIFVCLSTKAMHIDLFSNLTAAAFIACFKRFVSRRGKCTDLYSDNGKNFIGANRELRNQFKQLIMDQEVQSYLAQDGTIWHFNPPLSPHFGGLFEAGVKSMKYHLKRLVGNNTFTFEEMVTLLCQIEACLNSRPLCQISNDLNDVSYLTPGHFLIGEAPINVPEISLLEEKVNRLSRWKLVQYTYQQFWKCWYTEYLSSLQQRPKWLNSMDNVKVGQLVLLREDNVPPGKWPVAKILEVYPGEDTKVRVVKLEKHTAVVKPPIPKDLKKYLAKLETHKSILKRPITKISVLPIEDNEMLNGVRNCTDEY